MGDVTITNSFRERLEREMDGMQASLQQINEANKPPPPRHDENRRNKVEQFFHRTFGWWKNLSNFLTEFWKEIHEDSIIK